MEDKKPKLKWHTEQRKIDALIPFEKNPRKITDQQKEDLRKSLEKFDLVEIPAIDTDNKIVAGHQRLGILKLLGKGGETIDVRMPNRKLTDEEFKEYNLRSNKNTGEWDYDLLGDMGEGLLLDVGFDKDELDMIFKQDISEDSFNVFEEYEGIKKPKAKIGDLYLLGNHRLFCGDSTKEEDVDKLMKEEVADMVFTDPPYNMNYKSKEKGGIIGDNQTEKEFIEFSIKFIQRMKESLRAGGTFYICSGYGSYIPFVYAMKVAELEFANPIIWVKNSLGMGMNDYRHKHEMLIRAKKGKKKGQPILYGWKEGEHYFKDVRNEADVWEIKRRATNILVHPTQKPIELCSRAIRNSSKRDEIVLDLFGGSGSTLISAEKEGRTAYLMELDPKYIDIIINRWEAYTKEKAIKQG